MSNENAMPCETFTQKSRRMLKDNPDKAEFTMSRRGLEALVADAERYAEVTENGGVAVDDSAISQVAKNYWGCNCYNEYQRNGLYSNIVGRYLKAASKPAAQPTTVEGE